MLAQSPNSPVILAQLAQAFLHDAQFAAALATAGAALAGDAALLPARLTRAAAYKALGRFDEAAEDLAQANALSPGRVAILVTLGTLYAELDRLDEAEFHLREAILRDPLCKEAHANLGAVHARQEKFDLAEAACREALALDAGLITAHQNLAAILTASQPEAARTHRDAAYQRQHIFVESSAPANPSVLVLTTADAASVPLKYLLPRQRYTQIRWFIDYAKPDDEVLLPPYDLVFNAIGDPDFMPPLPVPVQHVLQNSAPPVLNNPTRILNTHRSSLPDLLKGIANVVVPPVIRLTSAETNALDAIGQAGITLPAIIRPAGSHGGENLQKVTSSAEALQAIQRFDNAYVTKFVDYRNPDGLYRKYRVIFVDRQPYPYHLAIGPDWLVHYWTAGMANDAIRRQEERRFLEAPEAAIGSRAMAALAEIGARLDLDYAGIDFSCLPGGQVLVFEANATMLVHPEHEALFAYKNPAMRQIAQAFEAMLTPRLAKPRAALT